MNDGGEAICLPAVGPGFRGAWPPAQREPWEVMSLGTAGPLMAHPPHTSLPAEPRDWGTLAAQEEMPLGSLGTPQFPHKTWLIRLRRKSQGHTLL